MRPPTPSVTMTINSIALQKKQAGEKIFNFSAGDPNVITHPSISQKAIEKINQGHCPYPPLEGIPELKKLFLSWFNKKNNSSYKDENILITAGGKFALFAYLLSELSPNDDVLIPTPYWVSYPEMVLMANGNPIPIPTSPNNNWKLTKDLLKQYTTKNSKVLILNNASNPTGTLYSKQELQEIVSTALCLNLKILSDEVYSGLVYDNQPFTSVATPELNENITIVESCSKHFAMTGWRVGFLLGSKEIVKKICNIQGQSTTGTSLISQWAAVGALENGDAVNAYVRAAMQKRRDLFISLFNSLFNTTIPNIPSSIYAFLPISSMGFTKHNDSKKFCEEILKIGNVALVPGTAFGQEGYVRFAFSDEEEKITEGLHALKSAIQRINEQ